MYQNKINLTPQDILEKEFKIDTRGYRLKEVDQFLDTVIGDYEQFQTIIRDLEKERDELLSEIDEFNRIMKDLKKKLRMSIFFVDYLN